MLNKTSSFYKPINIDFTVMGLDDVASKFLNWCMENRENLEFIKECKTLDKISQAFTLHLDHESNIQVIDDVVRHTRA